MTWSTSQIILDVTLDVLLDIEGLIKQGSGDSFESNGRALDHDWCMWFGRWICSYDEEW